MCSRHQPLREARCPVCFHYFELIDEEKLRKWIPEEFLEESLTYIDQEQTESGYYAQPS